MRNSFIIFIILFSVSCQRSPSHEFIETRGGEAGVSAIVGNTLPLELVSVSDKGRLIEGAAYYVGVTKSGEVGRLKIEIGKPAEWFPYVVKEAISLQSVGKIKAIVDYDPVYHRVLVEREDGKLYILKLTF